MSDYWPTMLPGHITAGLSFWALTDTNRAPGIVRCVEPDCDLCDHWGRQRDDGCLALNGRGDRCAELAQEGFPFCARYHARHAVEAFGAHLAASLGLHERPCMEVAAFMRAVLDRMGCGEAERIAVADAIAPMPEADAPPARTAPLQPERTALYRHYDADGVLLYVGIAVDPAMRFKTHAKQAPWTAFAARHEGEWFATREEAAEAERAAIRDERPLFNKAGADPDRDERVKRYLIEHEAWELLSPAA